MREAAPPRAIDPTARGEDLAAAAVAGDRRALARLLTAVENRTPVAEAAMRRLYPQAGRAHLVGITGPPGSGKSTLVAALIERVRAAGRSVGVVAVDPSSPITGGALLGDRVRMQAYAGDGDVFIRSMASRGHAGGLASTSTAAAAVMDASGFDLILIETVGTGQSEVEVAAAADTTVVLEAPEMGDEVQAIKAGLLEVADLVVVNKGDRPGALRTASQLRAMLVAGASPKVGAGEGNERPRPKRPDVLVTTASTGEGVDELLVALDRHRDGRQGGGLGRRGRQGPPRAGGGAGVGDPVGPPARCASRGAARRRHAGHARRGRRAPTRSVCRRGPAARGTRSRPQMTAAGERLVTRPFVVLVAAGLAFFTAGGAVLPVASQFAEGPLDATTLGVGIAIGAFAIGSLLLRPVVGWGSDRFGRRPMLLLGTLLSIAGLALHLFVDTLPMLVLARAILGAAEAFFFVALLAAASDLAPEGRRGEAFNLASLALYIGLALGPPIGETVLDVVGLRERLDRVHRL